MIRVAAHRADRRGQPDVGQPLGGQLPRSGGTRRSRSATRATRGTHTDSIPWVGQEREQVPGRVPQRRSGRGRTIRRATRGRAKCAVK